MVYGGGYEACHQDLYDPTGEQDLDGFDGFDCQAQCGLSFMYFEGISACVSLTTKHVYCVTPCQLNRLLLFLVTIGIKIGKIKETNGFNRGNKSWFWDEMLT